MGEIIVTNVGHVGNNIGCQYLQKLIEDHYLDQNTEQIKKQNNNNCQLVSFQERNKNKYNFRGIFDYSDSLYSQLQNTFWGPFIDPDYILSKNKCNFSGTFQGSKNYFRNEKEVQYLEKFQNNLEDCDKFNCHIINHSTYDYSSGLASGIISISRNYYSEAIQISFSVFPNLSYPNTIEIYNFGFSVSQLVEYCDITMVYDYQALEKTLQQNNATDSYQNHHNVISDTIQQLTCSQRFYGYLNGSMRKIATNLIPFPRQHFLTCSMSVINNFDELDSQIQKISNPTNSYFTYKENQVNEYQGQALITRSAEQNMYISENSKNINNTTGWIDSPFLQLNCKVEHPQLGKTIMQVGNQKYFGQNLKSHSELFTASFRRKAFLSHYQSEGVEEMDFQEVESNLNDLVSEYYGCFVGDYQDEYYDDEENY